MSSSAGPSNPLGASHRRLCRALVFSSLAAGLLIASACRDSDPVRPPDLTTECTSATLADSLLDVLGRAEARWQALGIQSYVYSKASHCECWFEYPQPLALNVVGDRVISGRDGEGVPLPPAAIAALAEQTIPYWFERLRQALESGPDHADACFDADLAYPRRIFIDYDAGTADEEWAMSFEVLAR